MCPRSQGEKVARPGVDPGESDGRGHPGSRRLLTAQVPDSRRYLTAQVRGAGAAGARRGGTMRETRILRRPLRPPRTVKNIERLDPDSEIEAAAWNLLEVLVCSARRLAARGRVARKAEPCRRGPLSSKSLETCAARGIPGAGEHVPLSCRFQNKPPKSAALTAEVQSPTVR